MNFLLIINLIVKNRKTTGTLQENKLKMEISYQVNKMRTTILKWFTKSSNKKK
jgi:hypothetical protein